MPKIKENMEGTQSNQLLHCIAPFYIFKLKISNSFNNKNIIIMNNNNIIINNINNIINNIIIITNNDIIIITNNNINNKKIY